MFKQLVRALRPKSPSKCARRMEEARTAMLTPPVASNDHEETAAEQRVRVLMLLAETCMECDRRCPRAGGSPMVRRA